MRISREFPIRERLKLSLLGEAFNVFNHTNVYTVNTQQYTYTGPGTGVCSSHTNGLPGAGHELPDAERESVRRAPIADLGTNHFLTKHDIINDRAPRRNPKFQGDPVCDTTF
ncbi:MAG TPA: hypothetical protein VNV86_10285 [Candidatus Acidoferrum sp.]|nr:hypothetical protein [Candidatus Acidoferrum sp.]